MESGGNRDQEEDKLTDSQTISNDEEAIEVFELPISPQSPLLSGRTSGSSSITHPENTHESYTRMKRRDFQFSPSHYALDQDLSEFRNVNGKSLYDKAKLTSLDIFQHHLDVDDISELDFLLFLLRQLKVYTGQRPPLRTATFSPSIASVTSSVASPSPHMLHPIEVDSSITSKLLEVSEFIHQRVQFLQERDDAAVMRRLPCWKLALYRLPALTLTLLLEVAVGLLISTYSAIIKQHILITSFMPLLASVAGNMGMQSSASTVRFLAKGYVSLTNATSIRKLVSREFRSGIYVAAMVALMVFLTAALWGGLMFGLVTATAIFLSCIMAGLVGTLTPLLFKSFRLDPATMSGPFETALQDMCGNALYLSLSKWILGS